MSRNAHRYVKSSIRRQMAVNEIEAEYHRGDDVAEATDPILTEDEIAAIEYRRGKIFVSAHRVEAMVNSAKEEFCRATKATLPWNLDCRSGGDFGGTGLNYGPGNLGRHGDWRTPEEAGNILAIWGRFAGWLRSAKDQPSLVRLIVKTQGRGQGARATKFNLWELQKRWPSPGRLERKVRAVRQRANQILSAYDGGVKVSYKGIALGLLAERTVGKAAVVAVAETLGVAGEYGQLNYGKARSALVSLHLCNVEDTSDGVQARREEQPRLVILGVSVYRIATPRITRRGNTVGIEWKWLVRSINGRSYHYSEWGGEREALRSALHAWKEQDKLASMDADLVGFLKGERGFSPLAVRQDSYTAGNCSAGTEAWLREQGWTARQIIPGIWMIPHLGNPLVRNVAMGMFHRSVEQR